MIFPILFLNINLRRRSVHFQVYSIEVPVSKNTEFEYLIFSNIHIKYNSLHITGRLDSFSREVAQERVKALGGNAKDNVTRNTAYLVVGEDPGGSKLTRARSLGTQQITEEEFLALLEEKDTA